MVPVKPLPEAVKEPMVAIVVFLFRLFGPRPSRPRWLSIRPGTIGTHPQGRNEVEDGHGRRLSWFSRGMTAQPSGEENEPAVAGGNRAEQREAFSGQTCPIETAVGVPCAKIEGVEMAARRVLAFEAANSGVIPIVL
jgi:hypothetical protein